MAETIYNAVEVQAEINQPAVIKFNFDEVKRYLTEKLDEYKGAVFTDDSIKDAKKYVASLRSEQKDLSKRITEVKKAYMMPFDEFKTKADELVELYDEPINFINEQVQAYEEQRKAEKKIEIAKIYADTITEELVEYLPLEKIYDSRWENTTYTKKKITDDIKALMDTTQTAINTINGMTSESVPDALKMYKNTLDMAGAISYINDYEQKRADILKREQEKQKADAEEKIRQEEREKIAREEQAKADAERVEQEKAQAVEQAKQETIEQFIPNAEGEIIEFIYNIKMNNDAKEKLEMFMDSIGIEYEQVL